MIGALLSNTPANLLRSSGVAGELEPGGGAGASGRERDAVRDSLASGPVHAAGSGSGGVLTKQAVLALQETDPAQAQRGGAHSEGPSADLSAQSSGRVADEGPADSGPASASASEGPLGRQGAGGQAPGGQEGGLTPAQTQDGTQGGAQEEDPDGDGLNEAEEKQVQELAKRDREVRAHEQAHARVGGAYAGAPSYTFQQGPDGKRYAIGGEVQIDTSKEKTPQETIRKMQIVIRAALAPAEPSSQDLKVAQLARSQLSEAQAEARQAKAEDLQGGDGASDSLSGPGAGAEKKGPEKPASEGKMSEGERAQGGGLQSNGPEPANGQAAAAYQSALQRAQEAESLLASVLA